MATVTRSNKAVPLTKKGPLLKPLLGPGAMETAKVSLPTELSEPVHDLNAYSILVHGERGIGKTSLAMQAFKETLLITFDPPEKSKRLLQVHCRDWVEFGRYIDALLERAKKDGANFPYKSIVIDGIDKGHQYCQQYTEKKLVVEDIADEAWGKGFNQLSKNFTTRIRQLMTLTAMPTDCGVKFISHSTWRDKENRRGVKINQLVPLMKSGADREITGLVDCVFAYQFIGKQRILVVRGDEKTYAKCRVEGHFFTPNGEPIVEVSMGNSAAEGWQNLLNAFHNKQTFTHIRDASTPAVASANNGKAGVTTTRPRATGGIDRFFTK